MTTFLMDPPEDTADGPEYAADAPADPDAPYGRRPDGRPYTQSPEARAAFGARMAAARQAAKAGGFPAGIKPGQRLRPKAPEAKTPAPARAKAKPKADPRQLGAQTFMTGLSAGLMAAGKLLKSPPFMYDGMTVQRHAGPVVDALVESAEYSPKLASWLEGMGNIGGPYAMLGMALLPMVAQVAVNHGFMKAGLMDTIDMEAAAKAAQAADQAVDEAQAQWQAAYATADATGDPYAVSDAA